MMAEGAPPTVVRWPPQLPAALGNGEKILCVSHISPDGDAVGSLLGMGWILRSLGKSPVLALDDAVPGEHAALPAADEILTAHTPDFESRVRQTAFDLIVCLDASSPDRMGTAYHPPVHESATLVVIDHHITNTLFGDVNWVAPECAATCEMLVYLAGGLGVELSGPLAECLLTGLVTDTLGFRTTNVTPAVMDAAMRLMQGGANLAAITQRTLNRQPLSRLKVWSAALPGFRLEDGVIWLTVTRETLKAAGHTNGDLDLSSFLITVDEADMSAVFTEKIDDKGVRQIDCSFRAKPGYNVAEVAFGFGGGGHPPAAGCKIAGKLDEVAARVVEALRAARREQQQNAPASRG